MFETDIKTKATALLQALRTAKLQIATAESCTGGLIAGALTEIPGSSDVVDRGFVTYSNAAKTEMLGVSSALITSVGAVSREVALAMADGALRNSAATVSVAVTGVAGPGGGSAEKPVGLVHVAAQMKGRAPLHRECRFGDVGRSEIRRQTLLAALDLVHRVLQSKP